MTDLLTPDEVQKILKDVQKEFAGELIVILDRDAFEGLCRDYLTLWDELQAERELSDQFVKQVRELEVEVKRLAAAVPHNHPIFDDGYYGTKK